MSEFDRLVGVNAAGDLPNDVRDKLFKSNHANIFKSDAIAAAKILIDGGDNLLRSELTSKIVALEKGKMDAPGPATKGQIISHDGSKPVWTENPTKILEGGVSGQVLTHNGTNAVWSAPKRELPRGGSTGQVLSKDEFGDPKWVNPFFNRTAKFDKDTLAKTQGFIIVNSTEPPKSANYTTDDGVTVPVIWHQPIEALIPTLPTRPYFYPDTTSIGIPPTVGFDYYLLSYEKDGVTTTVNRKLNAGENSLTSLATLPFKAFFGVKPRPGYKIPATFEWSMFYYDPALDVVFGADDFSTRPENSLIFNTPFGETESYWVLGSNSSMAFPMSPDTPRYQEYISEAPWMGGWFKIKNGALRLHYTQQSSAIGFKTLSRNMSVIIDFEKIDTRNQAFVLSLGASKNLINALTINFTGNGIFIPSYTIPDRRTYNGTSNPGKYRFTLIENRFEVEFPDGTIITDTINIPQNVLDGQYGPYFGIRLNNQNTDPNFYTSIKSITVKNHGV